MLALLFFSWLLNTLRLCSNKSGRLEYKVRTFSTLRGDFNIGPNQGLGGIFFSLKSFTVIKFGGFRRNIHVFSANFIHIKD